jgi:hypothetical protein
MPLPLTNPFQNTRIFNRKWTQMNADEEMAKTEQQSPQPEFGLDWIESSPGFLSAFICVHLRLKGASRFGQKPASGRAGGNRSGAGRRETRNHRLWALGSGLWAKTLTQRRNDARAQRKRGNLNHGIQVYAKREIRP